MESLAIAFDMPVGSVAHDQLASTVWMGGDLVTVRYWLGRLIGRNLFRGSDQAVGSSLQRHLNSAGFIEGSRLAENRAAWGPIANYLQACCLSGKHGRGSRGASKIALIAAFLADPTSSDSQLAVAANTTEKQVVRNADLKVLRTAWLRMNRGNA